MRRTAQAAWWTAGHLIMWLAVPLWAMALGAEYAAKAIDWIWGVIARQFLVGYDYCIARSKDTKNG